MATLLLAAWALQLSLLLAPLRISWRALSVASCLACDVLCAMLRNVSCGPIRTAPVVYDKHVALKLGGRSQARMSSCGAALLIRPRFDNAQPAR